MSECIVVFLAVLPESILGLLRCRAQDRVPVHLFESLSPLCRSARGLLSYSFSAVDVMAVYQDFSFTLNVADEFLLFGELQWTPCATFVVPDILLTRCFPIL